MYENHTVVSISTKSHCHPFPTECTNCANSNCKPKNESSNKFSEPDSEDSAKHMSENRKPVNDDRLQEVHSDIDDKSASKHQSDLFVEADEKPEKDISQAPTSRSMRKPANNRTQLTFTQTNIAPFNKTMAKKILKPNVHTDSKKEINFNDIKNKSKTNNTLDNFAEETVMANTLANTKSNKKRSLSRAASTIGRLGSRPVSRLGEEVKSSIPNTSIHGLSHGREQGGK